MTFRNSFLLLPLCILAMATCNNQRDQNNQHEQNNRPPTQRDKSVPYVTVKSEDAIQDEPKVKATLKIIRNDSVLVSSSVGIEYRGALSQSFDKKSYGFELRDAQDNAQEMSLLGMPADEDWILHGPMSDRSLLRNALAYSIARQIGRYAARWEFVELEVNGDYKGLYLLMEKLKRSPDRINIAKLSKHTTHPDSITGGYVLKIDKTAGTQGNWSDYTNANSFHSRYDARGRASLASKIHYLYEYPKATHINPAQKAYIQGYLARFEQAMTAPDFAERYPQLIDTDSFVDYFILAEWMQNNDAYRISTFLQKDRNRPLAMGPIWDCDIAFGPDMVFCGGMRRDAWVFRYNQYCGGDEWLVPFWWERLLQDPAFKAKVAQRWQALRQTTLSDANVAQTLQSMAQYLQQHRLVDANYERWSEKKRESYQQRHQKHVEHLKTWLQNHSQWIDREVGKL
ncbi:MAG: CotH kinase family protein [Spirosomaceae bacterium]|nr:CotH kinase family protein [Spirosomataceae bacterium]